MGVARFGLGWAPGEWGYVRGGLGRARGVCRECAGSVMGGGTGLYV